MSDIKISQHDNFLNKVADLKTVNLNFSKNFACSMAYLIKKKGLKRVKELYPSLAPSNSADLKNKIYTIFTTRTIQEDYYLKLNKLSELLSIYGNSENEKYNKVKYTLYSSYYKSAVSLIEKNKDYTSAVNNILNPIMRNEKIEV